MCAKMSQLHAELTEQAAQLGFESIEEAEQHGWIVNYESGMLEPPVVQPELDKMEELDKAHEAWVKERDHALEILDLVADVLNEINDGLVKTGDKELVEAWSLLELARETRAAANFIKEQCHD